MPLYIKDDAIDRLARRYQALTKATTKTEAVRLALQKALDEELTKPALADVAVAFCRSLKQKATAKGAGTGMTGEP
ncbi:MULTISPECIES: type II toxin-antitoxin system VapB family antitoxin [unclassified Rhizobium]|uniref:type II toxin-antitoxin system VapB family antitoxin n=1 Tax=unclassified Rhizobium TaxID=2613769 RepID=UPI001609A374|nr:MULTISPECIES: type II toxin-antitoxin system VapB family antitoxin [unclassified Rhizobium]MBB3384380.1 antitoxin VapB [Rhizobium sp. BK098]MBB3616260.1 antitoxin VapB [Rhizobium sp. BK609]MBB3681919.1 antitoxin VapB [Rhizobium sp. BK612]